MKSIAYLSIAGLLLSGCSPAPDTHQPQTNNQTFIYPVSVREEQKDLYHGVEVADPYRWLENTDSDQVKNLVSEENQLTLPYVKGLPTRENYRQRITELWNYEKYGVPFYDSGKYFYSYNNGLQNQSQLLVTDDLNAKSKVLLDPNLFSEDGTIALARYEVSPKASYLAYAKSDGGTDWTQFFVRNISTGEDLADKIEGTKFTSVSWLPDESGFYYSRYPKTSEGWDDGQAVSVYFHKLGTEQSEDTQVLSLTDHPEWDPEGKVIADGKYLLIDIFEGYAANAVYLMSLNGKKDVTKLFPDWDGLYGYIGHKEGLLYFTSTAEAETGKVISVDLNNDFQLREVIAAQKNTLKDASLLGEHLFVQYLENAVSKVDVVALNGEKRNTMSFPELGTIRGFYGSPDSPDTFYKLSSFTNPGTIYRYNMASGKQSVFKDIEVPLDLSQFSTEQVFYPSKDGTSVSMFLVRRKDLDMTKPHKTLLYGYGGFNVSLTPGYSAVRIAWLEKGHILTIPNLRGGGEYGESWHQAGTKLQKQNVFDDFIAAAEWLITKGMTTSDKLVIQGGSNGGLLVGAVLTQRPDLMAVALPAVGVLDMMRYHEASANAKGWSSDFGLSENPQEFAALLKYSPVHNVKPSVCYPATLITTGDHDDRVVPWHSYKFAAELQHHQACDKPVMLRGETRGGHGAGKPTWMKIENYADQWAFAEQGTD